MKFRLSDTFLSKFKTQKPPFGFNGLGELTYLRTYSRIKEDGKNEVWWETVRRVVEGTFNMQKRWIEEHQLGWSNKKAQKSAQEMYERIFNMKFLPPGRGLWAMGSPIIEERGIHASLNNCAYTSTATLKEDLAKPFCFLMDMSMLGVGVGFDTKGAGAFDIKQPSGETKTIQISDDREGWVDSVRQLIESYFLGTNPVTFDYSLIRGAGVAIKGFGGVSSGPEPLKELHQEISKTLDKNVGSPITITTIVDIMNMIGKCVVAGNVRRCLPAGTLVHTKEGLFPIERVRPGMLVKTSLGYSEVSENVYQGTQSVVRINTEHGDFHCTGRHRMAVYNNGGYEWKRAFELTNNDSLVFVGGAIEGKDKKFIKINRLNLEINESVAWFIGYLQGNAEVNLSDKVIAFDSSRDQRFDLAIDTLDWDVIATDKNRVVFSNGDFLSLIKDEIPEFVLRGSHGIRSAYLSGLGKQTHERIHNRKFWKQVQALYASMGLPSKLTGNGPALTAYHFARTEGLAPVKVLSVEHDVLETETYDLSVPGANEFVADNGLLVHNTAEIVFGDYNSDEYLDLKNYEKNPDREMFGWASNNSIFADLGMDYSSSAARTAINGEPGFAWLENMQNYSRMNNGPDYKDHRVRGGNPCLEQSLESYETCCLVETFPYSHTSLEDYKVTLKYAYLYAKTVTLGKTHWAETNRVMLRNRRIGCSMSGIAQFVTDHGLHTFKQWCEEGYKAIERYDDVYSDWLAIPKSIKKTSIKPSGTVSLLAGATPGMHYPEDRFYIRRMRLGINSNLVQPLIDAGYKIEPCFGQEDSTVVVEIPVKIADNIRTINDVSMWEQLSLAAFLQKYWADNQVSSTITFKPEEANQIQFALNYFQYQLKGISFLPKTEKGAYRQMPYEGISEAQYEETVKNLKPIVFNNIENEEADVEKFCNNDTCLIK